MNEIKDLKDIPPEIRESYYYSMPSEDDTDQLGLQKLNQFYHIRHDLIHFLCEQIMGIKSDFRTMNKLETKFSFLPNEYKKMSPDIFVEFDNKITFIDISVSKNKEFNLNIKKDKYDPILHYISSEGFTVSEFYLFWVDPSWSNLESAIKDFRRYLTENNLSHYPVEDSLIDKLIIMHENVSILIQELRRKLPAEQLNFFDVQEQPLPHLASECELLQACNENYGMFDKTIKSLDDSTLEEAERMFTNLVNDEDLRSFLKDDKHDHTMYNRAFEALTEMERAFETQEEKPSFFVPYAGIDGPIIEELSKIPLLSYNKKPLEDKLRTEQSQILKILGFIRKFLRNRSSPWIQLCLSIEENLLLCLDYKSELELYNTGLLTGDFEKEVMLTKDYLSFRKTNQSSMSKRTFFKQHLQDSELRDVLPYIYRNKCIRIGSLDGRSRDFLRKSGTSYRKENVSRQYSEKRTVCQDSYKEFSNFMDLLESKTDFPHKTHPFLGTIPGVDSINMEKLKVELLEEQSKFLSLIQHTHCHSMSRHTSLSAAQLLHFNELNTSDNTFYLFTCGQPNILHIVRGGSLKRGADVGQAFFTVFLTTDPGWCSKVYGKITIEEFVIMGVQFYICRTPWVRLTSERLSFMKDQYYSTLSTAYDTWARNRDMCDVKGFFRHMYTFRTCISMSPTQRVAELLMDTRYIFMSALSIYSNVEKLIVDKLSPPYKNCLEQYIVRQLEFKCRQIILYLQSNKPKPNKPGFSSKERLNHTLGGTLTIPSLWSDFILQDLQSVFDDIFVYVHTSKEPSSEYHEQIKAINTILKYQKEYNELSNDMKYGFGDEKSLKKWILSGSQVGCSSKIIFQGSKLFSSKYKGLYKSWDFRTTCLEEPIGNFVSTKSCIPELDRKVEFVNHEKGKFQRVIDDINSLVKSGKSKYIVNGREVLKKFCVIDTETHDDIEMVVTKHNRVKVHDAIVDWIGRFGLDKNFIIDIATWNILSNGTRVITDTCIKAQYGAKREFYVINLGAKAMARVTENSYKCLAKVCKNEMISVPGDKKLLHIQSAVNESILSSERRQDSLLFVNGDCTKWSSCETMASFISMNFGLKDVFGSVITNYNMVTFCSWANKYIQVPQSILKNLRFLSSTTSYLEEKTLIHSTQNFLQGMFNYSSSLKAVISTEFAIYMFRKNNPEIFLHCSHLEHSDDYSLIVRTRNLESFELFRIYHKLSQKLFGINDSIKKTNIQSHIQEFISLFSFNGQLYYPFIKKTKEVGTNLPCNDYRSDIMSVTSRVSEAVRIGVPIESCYFMQRVHCASIADSYSLTPGMKNSFGDVRDMFSRPIELFGFPDMIPVLSVVVKGNPDNYRIYRFGSERSKNTIRALFKLGLATLDSLDLPTALIKESMSEFYTPKFSYPIKHNKLSAIKEKLNFDFNGAKTYIEENMSDSIVKPVETNRLYSWLKYMYYNRSFCRAYMRVSRAAMTLRHSLFSSKPCVQDFRDHLTKDGEAKNFLTIKNFLKVSIAQMSIVETSLCKAEEQNLEKSLNCYNSCLELFYNMIDDAKLIKQTYICPHTTVNRMPDPYNWLTLENNISILLQYVLNPKNFLSDRRQFLSETSLSRDISKLGKYFNLELLKSSLTYCRQVFSEVNSQSQNRAFGLTFINDSKDLPTFIKQYFEMGLIYGQTFLLAPVQRTVVTNISTGLPLYIRDWKTNSNIHSGVLSQLALIYRCIVLRTNGSQRSNNLRLFLEVEIPDLKMNVKSLLSQLNLISLRSLGSGELVQKIFCFLKQKLLTSSLDLLEFIKTKFFYKHHYIDKKRVLKPFSESADIMFLGIRFRAYLYIEGEKKYVIVELGQTNRAYWFYCYSIAQKVLGVISQAQLDERLLETRDFILPFLPQELCYLLEKIAIPKLEPKIYRKSGNIFKNVTDFEDANLPIIVQNIRINSFMATETQMSIGSNISTTDLEVHIGNILLFKLPFGNLTYENYLDYDDKNICNIKIDGVGLNTILKHKLLVKYLKSQYTFKANHSNFCELVATAIRNCAEDCKLLNRKVLRDMFDLDILNVTHDTKDYIMGDVDNSKFLEVSETPNEEVEVFGGIDFFKKMANLGKDIDILGNHDKEATDDILEAQGIFFEGIGTQVQVPVKDTTNIEAKQYDNNSKTIPLSSNLVESKPIPDILIPTSGFSLSSLKALQSNIIPGQELGKPVETTGLRSTIELEPLSSTHELNTEESIATYQKDKEDEEKSDALGLSIERGLSFSLSGLKELQKTNINNASTNLASDTEIEIGSIDTESKESSQVNIMEEEQKNTSEQLDSMEEPGDICPPSISTPTDNVNSQLDIGFQFNTGFNLSSLKSLQKKNNSEIDKILSEKKEKEKATDVFKRDIEVTQDVVTEISVDTAMTVDNVDIPQTQRIGEHGSQFEESFLSDFLKGKLNAGVLEVVQEGEPFELSLPVELGSIRRSDTQYQNHARTIFEEYNALKDIIPDVPRYQKTEHDNKVEYNRDAFATITDIDPDEVGELFDHPSELLEYQESSSSSESDSEEGINWFQLVPSRVLIEGRYNYEQRCRDSMVSINKYLIDCLIKPDMQEMMSSSTDILQFIKLINYVKTMRNITVDKDTKNVLRGFLMCFKDILKSNPGTQYCIDRNITVTWKDSKIRFFAVKSYESRDVAREICNRNPKVNIVHDIRNCDASVQWLSLPLLQQDLNNKIKDGFKKEDFSKSTLATSKLNSLIPKIIRAEFDLSCRYDF